MEGLRQRLNPIWTTALLLGGALVTWIVTVDRMQGMDNGPGTDLGALGWFLGVWVTMMAAMMLPSVAPMVLLFARVSRERASRGREHVPTWIFVLAYLAVWAAYGLAAYGIFRLVKHANPGFLSWHRDGPYVAGGAIIAAGIYQLTPLKEVCLRHCRGPMHYLLHGWKEGRGGAILMGAEHGLYCVGCCWGLFIVLFAVGVMSIFWMALIAAVVFAEKVLPYGEWLARAVAVGLVALGIWIAAAPSSVPGLTQPSSGAGMQMSGTHAKKMGPARMPAKKTPAKKMMK
jgi:predicted metal-binding membrane protein